MRRSVVAAPIEASLSTRVIWICIALGGALFGLVIATRALGFWTVLLAVVLAVCPLAVGWAILQSRGAQKEIDAAARKPRSS